MVKIGKEIHDFYQRTAALVKLSRKVGFLHTPCKECGQKMVVARNGKKCLNCGVRNE